MILGRVALVSDNPVVQKYRGGWRLLPCLLSAILSGSVNTPLGLEKVAMAPGITFLYFNAKGQDMVGNKKKYTCFPLVAFK